MPNDLTISSLLPDLQSESTVEFLMKVFEQHGFSLSKADYDALLMHLLRRSGAFSAMNSFERAELLGMPISRYRSINRRSAMWQVSNDETEQQVILRYLSNLINRFRQANQFQDITEVRVVVEDEVDKLTLEKFFLGREIPLSFTGNALVLQKNDAAALLGYFGESPELPEPIRNQLENAQSPSDRSAILFDWLKSLAVETLAEVIRVGILSIPRLVMGA